MLIRLFYSAAQDGELVLGDPTQKTVTETVQGLSTFVVEEAKIKSRIKNIPEPRDKSPFLSQTPTQILQREYEIGDPIQLTAVDGPFIFQANPSQLITLPAISQAMATFRYMRWDSITWRIQQTATPFTYGWFAITGCPTTPSRHATNPNLDYGWLSHEDCMLIDVASMPEAELTIPWLFNTTWLDYEHVTETNIDRSLDRLNSLKIVGFGDIFSTSSTTPKTVEVAIFARLNGVEVAGPVAARDGFTTSLKLQSGIPGMVADELLRQGRKYAEKHAEAFTATAAEWMTNQTKALYEHYTSDGDTPDAPIPVAKSTEDGGAAESMDVVPSIYGNMNFSRPRNLLGGGHMPCPQGVKTRIKSFIMLPWMSERHVILGNSTDRLSINASPFSTSVFLDTPECSRLDFIKQFFRMWRGGITLTFAMFGSPMNTFRLVFKLHYSPTSARVGDIVSSVVTVRGSTIHRITIPYLNTFPWMVCRDTGEGVIPYLTVENQVPAARSGDIVPSLALVVYKSAASDFQFAGQQNPQMYDSSPSSSKIELQMRTASFNFDEVMAGALQKVAYTSEDPEFLEDLAKRWTETSSLWQPDPSYHSGTSPYGFDTLDCLSTVFLYWRGQLKYKVLFDAQGSKPDAALVAKLENMSDGVARDFLIPLEKRWEDGVATISLGLTQMMEFTVPYICGVEWWPTMDIVGNAQCKITTSLYLPHRPLVAHIYSRNNGETSPAPAFIVRSVGDDFVFSYHCPPPYSLRRWYERTLPAEAIKEVKTPPRPSHRLNNALQRK